MTAFSIAPPAMATPLLPWLVVQLAPMSRTKVKEWLRDGRFRVNGTATTRHDLIVSATDTLTAGDPTRAPKSNQPELPILYRDDALIVIDKPAGLLTVATDSEKAKTAFVRINEALALQEQGRVFVVHRLDRETSGLLVFARSAAIRDTLQENWESVRKSYLAITEGVPELDVGVVSNYLLEGRDLRVREFAQPRAEAKHAITHYQVLARTARTARILVDLETGRKHQIRVHLSGLGCPIVGDPIYNAATNPAGRLCLHAWRLVFDHPTTGQPLQVEAPFPDALARLAR